MSIPSKATGAGNVNAAEVFKVTFSEALSTAPILEAWDNSETFPAVVAEGTTTEKEIFTGTAGNGNKPMLAGYIGGKSGSAVKPGALWHPAFVTAGAANPNLLVGSTNYVEAGFTPAIGENFVFNLSLAVPYDATVPSVSSMSALIQIRYTHTGEAPTVTFAYNEGAEGTPSYTTITPGTNGVRFCNAGTVAGDYKLTLPASGIVYAAEEWITE